MFAAWRNPFAQRSRSTYAKVSEKLRGAGGAEGDGGEHHGDGDAEGERCDQCGQRVLRRVAAKRRHREAEFGRWSEHCGSRSMRLPPCRSQFSHMAWNCGEAVGNNGKPVNYG